MLTVAAVTAPTYKIDCSTVMGTGATGAQHRAQKTSRNACYSHAMQVIVAVTAAMAAAVTAAVTAAMTAAVTAVVTAAMTAAVVQAGARLAVSEMVIASTLRSGSRASQHLARFHAAEATRSVQLYGVTPDSIDWACRCGCMLLWGREGIE